MATTVLNVPGISCEHCERAITGALTPVVQALNVNIAAKQVSVEYDPAQASLERIKGIPQEEDYPVESVVSA